MMEWQPIETAPRDGEPILVANSRLPDHAPVVVRWLDEMSNPDTGWCDAATPSGDALYFNARYFDYWMPVPAVPSMMPDWTRPIQFANGDPCELLESRPEGYTQWGPRSDGSYPTRMIHRLGIDESTTGGMMSAYWWMHEDGKSNAPGFSVVNIPALNAE